MEARLTMIDIELNNKKQVSRALRRFVFLEYFVGFNNGNVYCIKNEFFESMISINLFCSTPVHILHRLCKIYFTYNFIHIYYYGGRAAES